MGVAPCGHACYSPPMLQCHCALDPKGSAPPEALELWMSVAEQALHTLWNLM